jgi:hypothetical protein
MLELDLLVAVRLDGYRWVTWREGSSPDLPRESLGRFLAPPDGLLAHLYHQAPLTLPTAPQPYRHLPGYSRDPTEAFRVCERVRLFRDGRAELGRDADGAWRLTLPRDGLVIRHASLPSLLCRAALAWADRSTHRRQEVP